MAKEKTKHDKQGRRLFFHILGHYGGSYKRDLTMGILAGVVGAAMAGFGIPFMLEHIFPVVFEPQKASDFLISLLDYFFSEESYESVLLWGAVLFIPLVMLIRGVATYVNTYLLSRAGMGMLAHLRKDLFARLQHLPLTYLDEKKRGDWMTYILQYTQSIQQSMITIMNDIIIQPLTLLFAVGYLTYTALASSQAASLLGNLLIAIICVPIVRLVGRRVVKQMRKALEGLSQINVTIEESLSAQREVRAFNLESRQVGTLRQHIAEYSRRMLRLAVWQQGLSPAIEIVSAMGLSFALYRGAADGLTLEQFSAIAAAFYFCYTPVKRLGSLMNQCRIVETLLIRVGAILEAQSDMPEPEQPTQLGKRARGEIRFSDVSFAYKQDEDVLRDIDIRIPAGQNVALVGPSGSGKTTFVNLLCRFYDTKAGSVFIDGVNVREISRNDRMRSIALVSQYPALFRGSIRENIRVGAPESNNTEVEDAAQRALVDEFTSQDEQGLDMLIGEGGAGLSGGQKQRVALARAFLKNAPIVVLDEATSALDMNSEARIQSALDSLASQHTCLIIAHRFSTIRTADRILLFDQGRIVGDGSHHELYDTSELYKRLYDEQVTQENNSKQSKSSPTQKNTKKPTATALPTATAQPTSATPPLPTATPPPTSATPPLPTATAQPSSATTIPSQANSTSSDSDDESSTTTPTA